jgi:hypothetical protein
VVARELPGHFVGFVEGRLNVVIPRTWEENILSAEANSQMTIQFPNVQRKPGGFRKTASGYFAPSSVDVKTVDNGLHVLMGESEFRLDDALVERSRAKLGRVTGLSALIAGESCYVALYTDDSHPYYMHCVERESSKLLWTANVWAGLPEGVLSRSGSRHLVNMVLKDGVLYLFGTCFECGYIEAVEVAGGKSIFRFSTAY